MAKRRGLSLYALLFAAVALAADAEVVKDLYAARVPVADQGDRALAAGAREALAAVLVKVSGSREVLDNPAIEAALDNARSQVISYAYNRDARPGGGLQARFEFDPAQVTRLVVDAGEALWTANRPPVLVWVVIEGPGGRHFVSPEATPEAAEQLLAAFGRRGVPVQFPLFDLEDASAVGPEDVWRLDGNRLRSASARYGVEHIAAGRGALLSDERIAGDWSYLGADKRTDRAVSASSLAEFLDRGVAMVAEDMAARYAVAPAESGAGVGMSVQGVTGYGDYARIVRWLRSLELVEGARLERIAGDRLELRLDARADAGQLATLIELNDRLRPLPGGSAERPLSYEWLK